MNKQEEREYWTRLLADGPVGVRCGTTAAMVNLRGWYWLMLAAQILLWL